MDENSQELAYLPEGELAQGRPVAVPIDKMRHVKINQLSRGYVVAVGCQEFAISTKEELVEKLTEYINDPGDTERKWERGELF